MINYLYPYFITEATVGQKQKSAIHLKDMIDLFAFRIS